VNDFWCGIANKAMGCVFQPEAYTVEEFKEALISECAKRYEYPIDKIRAGVERIHRDFHYDMLKDVISHGGEIPCRVLNAMDERRRNNLLAFKRECELFETKAERDIKKRIKSRVIAYIHYKIKGPPGERGVWEERLGYTIQELKDHLAAQFQPGMSWDNYGQWHIDHIKPIALFRFQSDDDEELKECWALNNLQPLWAEENIKKSCNYQAVG
jgi:hypothetical protein